MLKADMPTILEFNASGSTFWIQTCEMQGQEINCVQLMGTKSNIHIQVAITFNVVTGAIAVTVTQDLRKLSIFIFFQIKVNP